MCMCVYIYIYIHIRATGRLGQSALSRGHFKDTADPLFESDTLFLKCFACAIFSRSAVLPIEGCL